jgi:hypothetical protein
MTNGQNRQGRRSHAAAKPAKLKDGREKITLLVSKETNVKLSTLAALKDVARSSLSPGDPDRGPAGRRDLANEAGWRAGQGMAVRCWRLAEKPRVRLDGKASPL